MTGMGPFAHLLTGLLGLVLPKSERETVLGDITEGFTERCRDRGPIRARLWLLAVMLTVFFSYLTARFSRERLRESSAVLALRRQERRNGGENRTAGGGAGLLEGIGQDVRVALRMFRRSPIFTLAAVGCLGLGLGINTAGFTFFYAIMVRPLPFPEPDRLAIVFEYGQGATRVGPSFPDYADWRAGNRSFSELAIYSRSAGTLSGIDQAERIEGARISHTLFAVLEVEPVQGRGFSAADDESGAQATLLLSHRFWRGKLGGDPDIIGRAVALDEEPYTVIGIMPEGFNFPENSDYWIPVRLSPTSNRGSRSFSAAIGRLRPDVSLDQAGTELQGIAARLAAEHPETNAEMGVVVRSLADDFLWGRRTPVAIFYGAVCFLLLLACANVAHLMLTRASSRRREIAVRIALGAGRPRLIRQLLTESLLISLAAGGLGLILGSLGRDLYLAGVPEQFPYYLRFDLNLPVIAVMSGIVLLTGLLFGLAPLSISLRTDITRDLRDGVTMVSPGPRRNRGRSVLIASESCLALIVLVGAGLMLKSLARLRAVEPGFDPRRVLTMEIELPRSMSGDLERCRSFFSEVREGVGALPGIAAASSVSNLPMGRSQWQGRVSVERPGGQPPEEVPWAVGRSIQPDYFETMEIPLLQGREFDERDVAGGAVEAIIINRSFAERYWLDGDCLGSHIKYGSPDSEWPWMQIVGVVGDVQHYGLDYPIQFGYYRPFSQTTFHKMTLVARARSDPRDLAEAVRVEIGSIESDASVWDIRTMQQVIDSNHWEPILYGRISLIFASIALILAALGIYGMVSYATVQSTREFGLRLALGAPTGALLRLALGRVAVLTALGLGGGLVISWMIMRVLGSVLFGVTWRDAGVYALAALVVGILTLLAGYLPARRVTRLDTVTALRCE